MKMLVFSITLGAILLYFLNTAILKTPVLDFEWSLHASIRFFTGFFILGVICFYAKAISFKKAIYITAVVVLADYIYDHYTQSYRLQLEIILHGIYMIVWGAIVGYLTAKYIKQRYRHL